MVPTEKLHVYVLASRLSLFVTEKVSLHHKASNSCQGRCFDNYNSDNNCQCNKDCSKYGNCCDDFIEICAKEGKCTSMNLLTYKVKVFVQSI